VWRDRLKVFDAIVVISAGKSDNKLKWGNLNRRYERDGPDARLHLREVHTGRKGKHSSYFACTAERRQFSGFGSPMENGQKRKDTIIP